MVVDGVGSDWLSLGCPSCTHLTTTPSFITKESNQLRPQVPGTADLSTAFHTLGVSQGPALPSSLEEQEVLPYPEDIPSLVLTAYPPPWLFSYRKGESPIRGIICFLSCSLWGSIPVSEAAYEHTLKSKPSGRQGLLPEVKVSWSIFFPEPDSTDSLHIIFSPLNDKTD